MPKSSYTGEYKNMSKKERDYAHLKDSRWRRSYQGIKDRSPGEACAPLNSQPQWRKHLVLVPFSSSAVSTMGRIWAVNPCRERQKKSELEAQLLGHLFQERLPLTLPIVFCCCCCSKLCTETL